MISNSIVLAMEEAKQRLEGKTFSTLEERCKEAMRVTVRHWLITDEDERFRAAIGAVLLTCSPEEKTRIEEELQVWKMLAAALQGVPVDLSDMRCPENPIALSKLWYEVKMESEKCP